MVTLTVYGMPLEDMMGWVGGCLASDQTLFSEIADPLRDTTSKVLGILIEEILVFIPKDLWGYQPKYEGVICFVDGLPAKSECHVQVLDKLSEMITNNLCHVIRPWKAQDYRPKVQVIIR